MLRATVADIEVAVIPDTGHFPQLDEAAATTAVIADFLRHIKVRAEKRLGVELTNVVHGRPVHFVDGNPDGDRHAREHRDIVARFGRFPHRNEVLGRECTAEELDYLKTAKRFGQ